MSTINKQRNKQRGDTILEVIFYISLFVVMSLVVIDAMIMMSKSFKETATYTELVQSGAIMERMSREVRQAIDISSISNTDLQLDTTDSSGNSKTVEFLLVGTDLELIENNTLTGNLNSPNISVTALTFTEMTTTNGTAIKVTLTLNSKNDTSGRAVDFNDTVVLRGQY